MATGTARLVAIHQFLKGCSSEVTSPICGPSGKGSGTAGYCPARICPSLVRAGGEQRPQAGDPPPAYKQAEQVGAPQDVLGCDFNYPSYSEHNNRGGRWKLLNLGSQSMRTAQHFC